MAEPDVLLARRAARSGPGRCAGRGGAPGLHTHAELRVERIRSQAVRLRDGDVETRRRRHRGRHRPPGGARRRHRLRGHGRRSTRRGGRPSPRRRSSAARPPRPGRRATVELADEPGHGDGRVVVALPHVDPVDVPAGRQGGACSRDWSERLLARPAVDHVTASRAGGDRGQATTPTSPGTDGPPAPGPGPPRRSRRSPSTATGGFETMRTVAPPVGRGWEYLRGRGLGLGRRAGAAPGPAGREAARPPRSSRALRPRRSTRPTCGSPSTSRSATPPSSTGPSATRRPTPGRRSPPSTSSAPSATGPTSCTSPATAPTPHGLATVAIDDEGVAGPVVRPGPGRASSSATSSTGRSPPTAGLGRVQRLRLRRLAAARARSSGWPTSRSSRPPGTGRPPRS